MIFSRKKFCFKNNRVLLRLISSKTLPAAADVVIIGGGSQGCNTLYQLSKKGCNAVLLERSKLTAGTTWHTAGLVWRLRPNDVEIQLLNTTRETLMTLEKTLGSSGWIMNGGLFISHSQERLNEYKRLATLGRSFNIENYILTSKEASEVFPLLDANSFTGALYSPGDGVVDPSLMCDALVKASMMNGNNTFENCDVTDLIVEQNDLGKNCVKGVVTSQGTIRTNCVVNAAGVWGRDLMEKCNISLPLIPMKHAYIVTESIPSVAGMPNVRDHDYSIYFRIQGESILIGGYEDNPILLDRVPNNFEFGLYDLDWNSFEPHLTGAVKLAPALKTIGVKSTICGPESFTPDHKPLMGPDPRMDGLFHNCGYNSAGMMLGGGCGEVMAEWILKGRPSLHMFAYDVRRFYPDQTTNLQWASKRSYEAYAKNYCIVFPNDQPLTGRDLYNDPLHENMIAHGAVMEERCGWERPSFFLKKGKANTNAYTWTNSYPNDLNVHDNYYNQLKGYHTFAFSKHHNLVGEEAMACRENAALFNLSYFSKLFLTGTDAKKAALWLFTAYQEKTANDSIVYTVSLNDDGGVEADMTIIPISAGHRDIGEPMFEGPAYYIIAGGASAYHTLCHLNEGIQKKGFQAKLYDATSDIGILSLQGPNSRVILQNITDSDLSDPSFPPRTSKVIEINLKDGGTRSVRILRISFVGELGYELHIPKESCREIYDALIGAGAIFDLRNGGYRSLYSLSSEKGYHLWGFDLRSDDTPVEANLSFTCRKNPPYRGKEKIDFQRRQGVSKRLVFLTVNEHIPLWGLEAVYRDGEIIGHLRRGEYAYYLKKSIGQAYIQHPEKKRIDSAFISTGKYQIEAMGNLYDADCHIRSPFDSQSYRMNGMYE